MTITRSAGGSEPPIEGRTTNLSRGGLCATLAQGLPIGTAVEVDIVLVFEGDVRSEPLRLPAQIVWCTELDEGHQIGVAFRPLDADRADYLGLFIKYLDQGSTKERTKRDLAVDDRFR